MSNCVLNDSSNQDRIKLHTDNQRPSLFYSGEGYEEEFEIWVAGEIGIKANSARLG